MTTVCITASVATRPTRPRQAGFSLLEVLVAFSIMAMSFAMLYRVSGGSANAIVHVERNQHAVMLVESLLAGIDSVPENGWNEAGQSGGLDWQVQSGPYDTPVSSEFPVAPKLQEILVSVSWLDGQQRRQMDVKTLRPQRKPPPGAVVR